MTFVVAVVFEVAVSILDGNAFVSPIYLMGPGKVPSAGQKPQADKAGDACHELCRLQAGAIFLGFL